MSRMLLYSIDEWRTIITIIHSIRVRQNKLRIHVQAAICKCKILFDLVSLVGFFLSLAFVSGLACGLPKNALFSLFHYLFRLFISFEHMNFSFAISFFLLLRLLFHCYPIFMYKHEHKMVFNSVVQLQIHARANARQID